MTPRQTRQKATRQKATGARTADQRSGQSRPLEAHHPSRIRPIVMYPYAQPRNLQSLRLLFQALSSWSNESVFCQPVAVINNQTKYRSKLSSADDPQISAAYATAVAEIVKPAARVTYTWAVDSCAMWLRGLGDAFEEAAAEGGHHDIFFLIPGDFDFSTEAGKEALQRLRRIPQRILDDECEICLGEIQVPINSAKQLIDTYGTYGLLYNWFPAEAQGIRQRTDKPRTEFFAVNYETLRHALIPNRWFAYEQTLIILLQNMDGERPVRDMKKVELGLITDEEATRSTLAAAMQQVERTERALKLFWRERAISRGRPNWHEEFRALDAQSESVRTAAMVILRRVLK